MSRTKCLTADELRAFQIGDLPEEALDEVTEHLESCQECEAAAQALDDVSDATLLAYRRSAIAEVLAAPATPPERVGEYEVLEEVGRGGMGIVYRARHLQLKRIVALKMLLGGFMADGNERARFRAEAGAVARLHHPNIIQIYEFGEHLVERGVARPYFTLEFVGGGNLSTRMAGRPQPPNQAAAWLEAMARAAHYAHQHDVVHRDLKPSNILLTTEGEPKICDFGVAKLLSGSDLKTRSGTLVGTVEYMAPEQAAGDVSVGPPADIYALGAILYTALTGRPPFQGTSAWHTIDQVRTQEPVPPRRLQPQVPLDLDTICLKCLEKEPARRYPSGEALAEDLRRFLVDEPIRARRPSLPERCARWVRHHRGAALALTLVMATMAIAAIVSTALAFQKDDERRKAQEAGQQAKAAQERAEAAQRLAESQRERAIRNLYIAKTNLTGMTLDAPGGMTRVAQFLADWRGLRSPEDPRGWEWYYCQSLLTRDQVTLHGHAVDAASLAWSPDGKQLVSGGFDESIRLWDAQTGKQTASFAAPWGIMAVSWRSDGRRVASANWWDKTVSVWDVTTGKTLLTLKGLETQVFTVEYSPDGHRLAAVGPGSPVLVWNADTGALLGRMGPAGPGTGALTWSPDGKRLAASSYGSSVKVFDTEGGRELANLNEPGGPLHAVRWSEDGGRLAIGCADGKVHFWDMRLYATTGQILGSGIDAPICWSPGGMRVAAGCRDLGIRVWDVDTGRLVRTFQGHTGSRISAVCWSPDGSRLASAERGWNAEIKIWDMNAQPALRQVVVGQGPMSNLHVSWSPDGNWLASEHPDGGVRIWDAATGKESGLVGRHTGPVTLVRWNADGSFLASADRLGAVKVWDVKQRTERFAFQGGGKAITAFEWKPDGKQLAWISEYGPTILWDVGMASPRKTTCIGDSLAWSPDGRMLAVGEHYRVRLHDPRTGAVIREWSTSADRGNHPAWSPDGRFLASISDYAADVREVATGRPIFPPLRHTQPVVSLAWSPDGKQLVVATTDNRVHLWDAVTGEPVLTLPTEGVRIQSVAWSPDGVQLAIATLEGRIQIWDAGAGYRHERVASLLPALGARVLERPADREALALRAKVLARHGNWDQAELDARQSLADHSPNKPNWLLAGWWIADELDPSNQDDPLWMSAARWYQSADDPNGYVPLAQEPSYYLTRIYVSHEQMLRIHLDAESSLKHQVWLDGTLRTDEDLGRARLAPGWHSVAVQFVGQSPATNLVIHPRAGFYLRLSPLL